ncbi:MAG: hypothetical protein NC310_07120 [Roseburia sp.]|nr:hypothetical protein [Roseburia sp.]MCM1557803.1 hypothetical protein [Anaeroplasma bactoclasticum]
MKQYTEEIVGQREFYQRVGINPDLSHYTDGVDRGNLYENKLNISNINTVLFQAIKYASRIRIRGEKLPSNIILNDLNREIVYIFKSIDLLEEIEKVYFGAASRNNDGYSTNAHYEVIDYSNSEGLQELLVFVNSKNYIKYHVNKFNIIGLSQQFYKVNPDKDLFIKGTECEIRMPNILSDRILPYENNDNIEFEDIMDCLNPNLLQREQGAYYTPTAYVNEMHKMLFDAISEVPIGKDYIIIDRCAGTGNLQEGLPEEILKHCVLSTIEFNEYAILNYKYGDKCLVVIPNTDALAYDIIPAEHNEQGVCNDFIREKVNDPNCVIILMENPPFSESGSGATQKTGKKDNIWKQSFVMEQMRKDCSGVVLNDLANLFIWSGFKYYLTSQDDSYILYSPTKYWRNQNLVQKVFKGGFLCNRKEFHAPQASATGCVWWKNINDEETKQLSLPPYDISNGMLIKASEDIVINKTYHPLSEAYDKRKFSTDREDGIICERDGTEFIKNGRKIYIKPIYNENIIGYLVASNFQIDRKDVMLTRCGIYKAHGFFLRSDNFTEKLPLFVAGTFPYDKWYKTDVYSKSFDGQGNFLNDFKFLFRCLIYTALTYKNKCRSLLGSDSRFYRNELCFDQKDTIAYRKYQEMLNNGIVLENEERNLMKYWDDVLFETYQTEEYKLKYNENNQIRYGTWQIMNELNIDIDTGCLNKKGEPIYTKKYPSLNTELNKLNSELKKYYDEYIIPDLFKYQLIK